MPVWEVGREGGKERDMPEVFKEMKGRSRTEPFPGTGRLQMISSQPGCDRWKGASWPGAPQGEVTFTRTLSCWTKKKVKGKVLSANRQ